MSFITVRVVSVIRNDTGEGLIDAGANQSVLCAVTVQLEATIFGDATQHTFEWEQLSGTPVTLINPNTLTPSFANPQSTDIEFTFYLDRGTPFEVSDVVLISSRPTDFVTGGATGAAAATLPSGTTSVASRSPSSRFLLSEVQATPSSWVTPPAGYSPLYVPEDVFNIRNMLNAQYWLMNDIDLSEYTNWDPIGTPGKPFIGDLQGNGYVIDNLTITSATKDAGLFSTIAGGALIEKFGITNANISGVGSSVYKGILAGRAAGIVTVRDCYAEGTVASGGDLAGGFIGDTGSNASSIYDNTYADVTVTGGGTDVGGWTGTFSGTPTYIENYGNTTKTASIVGTGSPGGAEVSGLTTAQLNAEANYTGWDFVDTWEIDEGVSPAALQEKKSLTVRAGTCLDTMVVWERQEFAPHETGKFAYVGKGVPGDGYHVGIPQYIPKGARIEKKVGTNWVQYAQISAQQRFFNLAQNDVVRIYWRWRLQGGGIITKNIETLDPREFFSSDLSGAITPKPVGSDGVSGGATGASAAVDSFNLVIVISNPRLIAKLVTDPVTGGVTGQSSSASYNFSILRFVGVAKTPAVSGDPGVTGGATGQSSAAPYNLVITRATGINIG